MSTHVTTEGVTQYRLDWHYAALPPCLQWADLNAWRTRLFDRGVIGQNPSRYDGLGFGNVSCRLQSDTFPDAFLISGTQTGHWRELPFEQYCEVLQCNVAGNTLRARGPVPPSSEALTHHMVYHSLPAARFVLHVHAPALWQQAQRLGLPQTPADVGYGTPAMAEAVAALIASNAGNVVAMAGHEDGILAWGESIESLGQDVLSWLCRAENSV